MSQQQMQEDWLLDKEVEERTKGRITKSRLRKDRIGKQLFPFHRVGRNCYYRLSEIDAMIEGARCGGNAAPAPPKQTRVPRARGGRTA